MLVTQRAKAARDDEFIDFGKAEESREFLITYIQNIINTSDYIKRFILLGDIEISDKKELIALILLNFGVPKFGDDGVSAVTFDEDGFKINFLNPGIDHKKLSILLVKISELLKISSFNQDTVINSQLFLSQFVVISDDKGKKSLLSIDDFDDLVKVFHDLNSENIRDANNMIKFWFSFADITGADGCKMEYKINDNFTEEDLAKIKEYFIRNKMFASLFLDKRLFNLSRNKEVISVVKAEVLEHSRRIFCEEEDLEKAQHLEEFLIYMRYISIKDYSFIEYFAIFCKDSELIVEILRNKLFSKRDSNYNFDLFLVDLRRIGKKLEYDEETLDGYAAPVEAKEKLGLVDYLRLHKIDYRHNLSLSIFEIDITELYNDKEDEASDDRLASLKKLKNDLGAIARPDGEVVREGDKISLLISNIDNIFYVYDCVAKDYVFISLSQIINQIHFKYKFNREELIGEEEYKNLVKSTFARYLFFDSIEANKLRDQITTMGHCGNILQQCEEAVRGVFSDVNSSVKSSGLLSVMFDYHKNIQIGISQIDSSKFLLTLNSDDVRFIKPKNRDFLTRFIGLSLLHSIDSGRKKSNIIYEFRVSNPCEFLLSGMMNLIMALNHYQGTSVDESGIVKFFRPDAKFNDEDFLALNQVLKLKSMMLLPLFCSGVHIEDKILKGKMRQDILQLVESIFSKDSFKYKKIKEVLDLVIRTAKKDLFFQNLLTNCEFNHINYIFSEIAELHSKGLLRVENGVIKNFIKIYRNHEAIQGYYMFYNFASIFYQLSGDGSLFTKSTLSSSRFALDDYKDINVFDRYIKEVVRNEYLREVWFDKIKDLDFVSMSDEEKVVFILEIAPKEDDFLSINEGQIALKKDVVEKLAGIDFLVQHGFHLEGDFYKSSVESFLEGFVVIKYCDKYIPYSLILLNRVANFIKGSVPYLNQAEVFEGWCRLLEIDLDLLGEKYKSYLDLYSRDLVEDFYPESFAMSYGCEFEVIDGIGTVIKNPLAIGDDRDIVFNGDRNFFAAIEAFRNIPSSQALVVNDEGGGGYIKIFQVNKLFYVVDKRLMIRRVQSILGLLQEVVNCHILLKDARYEVDIAKLAISIFNKYEFPTLVHDYLHDMFSSKEFVKFLTEITSSYEEEKYKEDFSITKFFDGGDEEAERIYEEKLILSDLRKVIKLNLQLPITTSFPNSVQLRRFRKGDRIEICNIANPILLEYILENTEGKFRCMDFDAKTTKFSVIKGEGFLLGKDILLLQQTVDKYNEFERVLEPEKIRLRKQKLIEDEKTELERLKRQSEAIEQEAKQKKVAEDIEDKLKKDQKKKDLMEREELSKAALSKVKRKLIELGCRINNKNNNVDVTDHGLTRALRNVSESWSKQLFRISRSDVKFSINIPVNSAIADLFLDFEYVSARKASSKVVTEGKDSVLTKGEGLGDKEAGAAELEAIEAGAAGFGVAGAGAAGDAGAGAAGAGAAGAGAAGAGTVSGVEIIEEDISLLLEDCKIKSESIKRVIEENGPLTLRSRINKISEAINPLIEKSKEFGLLYLHGSNIWMLDFNRSPKDIDLQLVLSEEHEFIVNYGVIGKKWLIENIFNNQASEDDFSEPKPIYDYKVTPPEIIAFSVKYLDLVDLTIATAKYEEMNNSWMSGVDAKRYCFNKSAYEYKLSFESYLRDHLGEEVNLHSDYRGIVNPYCSKSYARLIYQYLGILNSQEASLTKIKEVISAKIVENLSLYMMFGTDSIRCDLVIKDVADFFAKHKMTEKESDNFKITLHSFMLPILSMDKVNFEANNLLLFQEGGILRLSGLEPQSSPSLAGGASGGVILRTPLARGSI